MTERQDHSLKDNSNQILHVIVSDEFKLVKIETDDGRTELTINLYEFQQLADWVLKRK